MGAEFEKALAFVLAREGGKSDHPADKGGRTNKGITQFTYDAYKTAKAKAQGVPYVETDVWEATDEEIADIYRRRYWEPSGASMEQWPLSLAIMDFAVHSGPARAKKNLQLVQSGGGTMLNPKQQAIALTARRRQMMQNIVNNDRTQKVFLKGWLNRVDLLDKEIQKS